MIQTSDLMQQILTIVRNELVADVTPYRAIVTGISSGKVQFRPVEATTGSSQLYARIAGFNVAVSDEIMVIGRVNPIVLGKAQRAASGGYALDAGLTLNGQTDTSGTAPTITAQAAAGNTAAIASVAGNDTCGFFQLTANGTGIAVGTIARIAFATSRPDTSYTLFLTPHSTDARSLGGVVGPTGRTTSQVDIDTRTALTAGNVYQWGYLIVGY